MIPLGIGGTYALTPRLDIGGDFTFDNLGGIQLATRGRLDTRSLVLRVAWRSR